MKETPAWWQGILPELSGCPHYKEPEPLVTAILDSNLLGE